MILRSIRLINFRSYSDSFFSFAPAGSIISGFNGSGKTNLLEAIAYSGTGKSVRFHHDEQLVRHDTAFFSIITDYRDQAGNTDLINLSCHQNKKLLKINNNPIRQLSHLFQTVKVTYLSPDDIIIINGSPRYRRQFFDLAMAQLFPEYIALYREYLHILLQRNALLKRDFTEAEKESWDTRYIAAMIKVMIYRHRYLQLLNDELALYRNELRLVIGLLG
ncbi:MAG: DNA replication/repair protein RecF, partial [Candidatus Cloacimonetes bacterium]|nr:DNA replication/repair protein RecF [Candidatus Cloacimonadota bacterium]